MRSYWIIFLLFVSWQLIANCEDSIPPQIDSLLKNKTPTQNQEQTGQDSTLPQNKESKLHSNSSQDHISSQKNDNQIVPEILDKTPQVLLADQVKNTSVQAKTTTQQNGNIETTNIEKQDTLNLQKIDKVHNQDQKSLKRQSKLAEDSRLKNVQSIPQTEVRNQNSKDKKSQSLKKNEPKMKGQVNSVGGKESKGEQGQRVNKPYSIVAFPADAKKTTIQPYVFTNGTIVVCILIVVAVVGFCGVVFYYKGYWRRSNGMMRVGQAYEQSRINMNKEYKLSKQSPYIQSQQSFREVVIDNI